MMNITCNIQLPPTYFILNQNCTSDQYPVTAIEYGVMGGTGYLFFIITYIFYNSVKVLNYSIYINAISNYWWNAYFLLLAIRSTVMSVQYVDRSDDLVYFYCNWFIGAFEALFLCYALSYQNQYRTLSLITQEIDEEIDGGRELNKGMMVKIVGSLRVCKLGGVILFLEFVLMMGAIILLAFAKSQNWLPEIRENLFWCYIAFLAILHITAIFISLTIAWKNSFDGPYAKTKIFLIAAVMINSLESVPLFIWNNCVHMHCIGNVMTFFDIFVILKFLSVFLIYFALHFEYHRLKKECQYLILTEVPARNNVFPDISSTISS